MWAVDPAANSIPQQFKPDHLTATEELVFVKIFKPRILDHTIIKIIDKILGFKAEPYSNRELLQKVNPRFPILTKCSMRQLEELCLELNEGRMEIKSML